MFKQAETKLKFRTDRVERLVSVSGTLPKEIQVAFKRKNDIPQQPRCGSVEKLMPCGMRYPEPFGAKPNFFIPILAVSSYVAPFFMLMFLSQNLHNIPLLPEFFEYLRSHTNRVHIPNGVPHATFILLILMLPMLFGGLVAFALSKTDKLGLIQKIGIWLVSAFLFVIVEICVGPLFT